MSALCAAPALTNAQTANLARSGGVTTTILGLNFGTVDATVTGSLASLGACSTSAWTSATALQCLSSVSMGVVLSTAMSVSALVGTRSSAVLSFDGTLSFPKQRAGAACLATRFGCVPDGIARPRTCSRLQRRRSREYGGRTCRQREARA